MESEPRKWRSISTSESRQYPEREGGSRRGEEERPLESHLWASTHLRLQPLPLSGIFQLLNSESGFLDFLINCGYSLVDSSSFFLNFIAISTGKQTANF